MFQPKERYQSFCSVCSKPFEADSAAEAIIQAIEHERELKDLVQQGKAHPRTHRKIDPSTPDVVPIK